jgi:hypothetical protein
VPRKDLNPPAPAKNSQPQLLLEKA